MFKCNKCNTVFINKKIYANHIRWQHNQNSKRISICPICNKEIYEYALPRHTKLCENKIKSCTQCNTRFIAIDKQKFCSSACSAKFNNKLKKRKPWTIEQKKRQSEKLKLLKPRTIFSIQCCVCNNIFSHKNKTKKTCSKACYIILLKINSTRNPNCGGETNYKRFVYNNIIFDSSWEVEIAKYLDSKNIKWERSRKHVLYWLDEHNTKRRYYPDFYLPEFNLYIDPKNPYKQKLDTKKMDFIKARYNIITGTLNECLSHLQDCSLAG